MSNRGAPRGRGGGFSGGRGAGGFASRGDHHFCNFLWEELTTSRSRGIPASIWTSSSSVRLIYPTSVQFLLIRWQPKRDGFLCSCLRRWYYLRVNQPKDTQIQFTGLLGEQGLKEFIETRYSVLESWYSIRPRLAKLMRSWDLSTRFTLPSSLRMALWLRRSKVETNFISGEIGCYLWRCKKSAIKSYR